VLSTLTRLVHDLGLTVLLAEHRLERVVQYADRVVRLTGSGAPPVVGAPTAVMATSPVAPPVVHLGRVAGWDPIPLSIRDARRVAPALRALLTTTPPRPRLHVAGDVVARVRGLDARYGPLVALRDVDVDLRRGEIVAVMGRNGAGKSTLLAHLVGLRRPVAGVVEVDGAAPADLAPRDAVRLVGLVPQDPGVLLYGESVDDECATADREGGLPPGATRAAVERVVPDLPPDAHPSDLSEGQRLGLALGIVLAAAPPLVLLDEPTRGLDYLAKTRLVATLQDLADDGHAVVLATHDVELVAEVADRVVVLADGEVVTDGPAREVVCHSPVFAPQVAKILAPAEWLTVAEVEVALA
jgi:energy-coupling factor transport system ATP-binding protein